MPAFAQDALFDDPLGAIKTKLEKEGIEVIDYSAPLTADQRGWGNLPNDVIAVLKENNFNLTHFVDGDSAKNTTTITNKLKEFNLLSTIQTDDPAYKDFTDALRSAVEKGTTVLPVLKMDD